MIKTESVFFVVSKFLHEASVRHLCDPLELLIQTMAVAGGLLSRGVFPRLRQQVTQAVLNQRGQSLPMSPWTLPSPGVGGGYDAEVHF